FERLNEDKKNNIINSAIHVFAQKGYKKAATDDIIRFAGISKGSLFVYFKNKQNLFLYVYDFVLETIINELLHENMTSERDVLERLKKFFLAELELVNKYPDIFEFVKMVNTESIPALSEKISECNLEKVNQSYAKVFENIDQTRFKDEIEIDDSDRKSTRLNSSHVSISYAVFCLKKKTTRNAAYRRRTRAQM